MVNEVVRKKSRWINKTYSQQRLDALPGVGTIRHLSRFGIQASLTNELPGRMTEYHLNKSIQQLASQALSTVDKKELTLF